MTSEAPESDLRDRPEATLSLPDGFDYIDLGELLDAIDSLLVFVSGRVGTYDEQDGEEEVRDRAVAVLAAYRSGQPHPVRSGRP